MLVAHDALSGAIRGRRSAGLRDANLLDSALARPQQIAPYELKSSVERLAAAYAGGIIQNHPFVKGDKRSGLLAAYIPLR